MRPRRTKHKANYRNKLKQTRKHKRNAEYINNHCIINLSSYELSTTEKSVLAKGLSFIPKPNHIDKDDILAGLMKH